MGEVAGQRPERVGKPWIPPCVYAVVSIVGERLLGMLLLRRHRELADTAVKFLVKVWLLWEKPLSCGCFSCVVERSRGKRDGHTGLICRAPMGSIP